MDIGVGGIATGSKWEIVEPKSSVLRGSLAVCLLSSAFIFSAMFVYTLSRVLVYFEPRLRPPAVGTS